jgi:hypothetical protein
MSPKEEDEHDKGRKISMGGSVRTGKAQLKNLEASDHALAARSANHVGSSGSYDPARSSCPYL